MTYKTPARQRAFLEAFSQSGTILVAAKVAEVPRRLHSYWMKDPKYREKFEEALAEFGDRVRHEVMRRALQGVKKEVRFQGKVIGNEIEYSDRMLELLAKAKCPEFRERFEHTGSDGGPVRILVEYAAEPNPK